MYNNYYNQQASIDRINNQINELEKMRQQIQQPTQPAINQTFQLASTQSSLKYANSINEVQRDMTMGEVPYFSKDMSVLWVKSPKGDIRTFELTEIIPKDEKDILISSLQTQIEELRKEVKNAKSNYTNDDESNSSDEPSNVSISKTSSKKQK